MMAVVAVARVVNAYLSMDGKVEKTDLDRSVLERKHLATIGKSVAKTVVAFDNVMTFPNPVPLATLKTLGCGSATQLLTSRRLTHEQTAKILHEGFQSEHSAERSHLA
jgi:hypothetical protein